MKSKILLAFVALIFTACNLAQATDRDQPEISCDKLVLEERERVVQALHDTLPLKEFGDQLFISEEEAERLNTQDTPLDTHLVYLGQDPFVNRVCQMAAALVMMFLEFSEEFERPDWFTYEVVFPAAMDEDLYFQMTQAEDDKTHESLWERFRQQFAEQLKVYPEQLIHVTVYNPKLDILIDLTYRQFLINRVSEQEFQQLPQIFVGSLTEYRNILLKHLPEWEVDLLMHSKMGGFFEPSPLPTLGEIETGTADMSLHPETDPYHEDYGDVIVDVPDSDRRDSTVTDEDFEVMDPVVILQDPDESP